MAKRGQPGRNLPLMSEEKRRLYVIAGDDGLVKIGVSIAPLTRLQDLQYETKANLELVWQSEPLIDCMKAEAFVHSGLSAYKTRGEWFKCHAADAVGWCFDAVAEDEKLENKVTIQKHIRTTISMTADASILLEKLKASLSVEQRKSLTISAVIRMAIKCLAEAKGIS
jgi:hypothetical protein